MFFKKKEKTYTQKDMNTLKEYYDVLYNQYYVKFHCEQVQRYDMKLQEWKEFYEQLIIKLKEENKKLLKENEELYNLLAQKNKSRRK